MCESSPVVRVSTLTCECPKTRLPMGDHLRTLTTNKVKHEDRCEVPNPRGAYPRRGGLALSRNFVPNKRPRHCVAFDDHRKRNRAVLEPNFNCNHELWREGGDGGCQFPDKPCGAPGDCGGADRDRGLVGPHGQPSVSNREWKTSGRCAGCPDTGLRFCIFGNASHCLDCCPRPLNVVFTPFNLVLTQFNSIPFVRASAGGLCSICLQTNPQVRRHVGESPTRGAFKPTKIIGEHEEL